MATNGIKSCRLYNNQNSNQAVWQRLSFDASVRGSRALKPTPPDQLFAQQPRGSSSARHEISGFVSNTSPVVFDKFTPMRTGHVAIPGEVPVAALRPLQLRRFKQVCEEVWGRRVGGGLKVGSRSRGTEP